MNQAEEMEKWERLHAFKRRLTHTYRRSSVETQTHTHAHAYFHPTPENSTKRRRPYPHKWDTRTHTHAFDARMLSFEISSGAKSGICVFPPHVALIVAELTELAVTHSTKKYRRAHVGGTHRQTHTSTGNRISLLSIPTAAIARNAGSKNYRCNPTFIWTQKSRRIVAAKGTMSWTASIHCRTSTQDCFCNENVVATLENEDVISGGQASLRCFLTCLQTS